MKKIKTILDVTVPEKYKIGLIADTYWEKKYGIPRATIANIRRILGISSFAKKRHIELKHLLLLDTKDEKIINKLSVCKSTIRKRRKNLGIKPIREPKEKLDFLTEEDRIKLANFSKIELARMYKKSISAIAYWRKTLSITRLSWKKEYKHLYLEEFVKSRKSDIY